MLSCDLCDSVKSDRDITHTFCIMYIYKTFLYFILNWNTYIWAYEPHKQIFGTNKEISSFDVKKIFIFGQNKLWNKHKRQWSLWRGGRPKWWSRFRLRNVLAQQLQWLICREDRGGCISWTRADSSPGRRPARSQTGSRGWRRPSQRRRSHFWH